MYHPEIEKLDAIATQLYAKGAKEETTRLQITAGAFQQELLRKSPYQTNRRYLSQQWCWAFGHIGLLQMLVRWFRLHEPQTRLVLETRGGCANEYFLKTLEPYISIVHTFPENMADEIMHNAVYFACPDGVRSIHNFYKMVAKETSDIGIDRSPGTRRQRFPRATELPPSVRSYPCPLHEPRPSEKHHPANGERGHRALSGERVSGGQRGIGRASDSRSIPERHDITESVACEFPIECDMRQVHWF
jgi:hypothetical protein